MKLNDWSKLSAKERIDTIIKMEIEKTGSIPNKIKISRKLFSELFCDDLIQIILYIGGGSICFYNKIMIETY